ncbi:ankyrin repeat domain-containing protein [Pochonia chlamydosporia 170]|uniref:Ankyrin repeat domain-containing protein n=1 Tax=Pochonia chlamydosporia 170 TaxID=1380566 RepID=A0A179FBX9_METCM|nr:ankyrin repeat domain-containing protein [Pochonia chlamydosporia 170]OAQ62928.1 ankyrin repeat domain-containing protein [Pochonia chlamydosporia 170]
MSNPGDYTVGWICALGTEYVAAQELLDDEHNPPDFISTNDTNDYTLGRLGKHNVVIAVLPDGEYGTSSAANVATHMLHSFPNVRIGLMVGIGGGAPSSKHDIRLGDIVVSAPRDGESGVFGYDFGKAIQGHAFHYTRILNQPPISLRTAMIGIQAQYERKGHRLEATINAILEKNPRLEKKYKRPAPETDRLFKAKVTHDACGCTDSCAAEPSNLVLRGPRTENEDNPAIHYGIIASANQLMKDATIRDKLAKEKAVLCFEMEAAGIMNPFPCVVIRGICDYADSHKNKEWQGYAAMVAAAYAKDLLSRIPPNKVEAEKKITDVMPDLHKLAEEHVAVAKQHLQVHENQAKARRKEKLSEEERKCHQLFRLTTGSKDATYEWYKDRVEDRVEDTCLWFLHHEHFQQWLKQDSGPLLVSADPGCGKSVLAKYLIDHALPQSASICYFFFKDQDQNTTRQALCALLHQLFEKKPILIRHAMAQYHKDRQGLINSTESLWKVLREAIKDPQAGSVIIVLDALDECAASELKALVLNVERQCRNLKFGHSKLKYLLTSRPYAQIMSNFYSLLKAFPNIRIPGEEEKSLSPKIKSYLAKKLLETTHRTYLWVYIVFDYLEKETFKKTIRGVKSTIALLPGTINEAYEKILSKSNEDPMVRKVLSIILAASRPLTLAEMNIAVNLDETSQAIHDLDLENEDDFKSRLRSWCGLFVSIHHSKIYFLHQTAREFLLAESSLRTNTPSELHWRHSISMHQAHAVLAKLCVLYLSLFNSNVSLPIDPTAETGHSHNSFLNYGSSDDSFITSDDSFITSDDSFITTSHDSFPGDDFFDNNFSVDNPAFLEYSAKNWASHFREANIMDDDGIISSALEISDPNSESFSAWFGIYWKATRMRTTKFTSLMGASYFGHNVIVKLLIDKGADVDLKDSRYGRTPLSWAAKNGHEAVVKLLLYKGAKVDPIDCKGETPLLWATENGHEAIVKLLLDGGAKTDSRSRYGKMPLSVAAENGHEAMVGLLLDKGADVDLKDSEYGRTPLLSAAEKGYNAIVKLLIDKGAEVKSGDRYGQTPLLWAAGNGHEAIVKLLLDKGAKVNLGDSNSQTPLLWAARNGHKAIVKLLLDRGAKVKSGDINSRTPLLWAAGNGHKAIVKLLLDKGANVKLGDSFGQTPLLLAAGNGHKAIVKLLLYKGANVKLGDSFGQTPLLLAAEKGHKAIVKLLLDKGAKVKLGDSNGQTPLSRAARNGHKAIVKLLLDKGAKVDSRDSNS